MNSLDELNKYLEENSNVLTLNMSVLRDLYGASKLGVNVVASISDELAKRGIGHYPPSLPKYQEECVRLYRMGSSAEKLIKAVLEVGRHDEMEKNDALIRDVLNDEHRETVKKIRELVCD